MKLKKYAQDIQKLLQDHPEYADLDVVYASDDEGNNFDSVSCSPSSCMMSEDMEWMDKQDAMECEVDYQVNSELLTKEVL